MCCDPLVPLKLIESLKGKIWLWSDSHTILSEYIAIVRDGDTDERRMPPEAEPTKCHGHVVTSKGRARSARRKIFEHQGFRKLGGQHAGSKHARLTPALSTPPWISASSGTWHGEG